MSLLAILVWYAAGLPAFVGAFPSYGVHVPNGRRVPCPSGMSGCVQGLEKDVAGLVCKGLGHRTCEGATLPLNPFGEALKSHDFTWTQELCEADSDNDGMTNGEELGDPCCLWAAYSEESNYTKEFTPSHPGLASDTIPNYVRPSCSSTELVEKAPPLGEYNPGEERRSVDFFINNYTIPAVKTTFVDFGFNFDDDSHETFHAIWADAIVKTPQYLHHYVVRGCSQKFPDHQVGVPLSVLSPFSSNCGHFFGGWAPGKTILATPNFAGRLIGKGADIVAFKVQVHYDNPGLVAGVVSNDGMRVHYTPTLRNDTISEISIVQITRNPSMIVPPQTNRYFLTRMCRLQVVDRVTMEPAVANILTVGYHAHLLGTEMYTELTKTDGNTVDLASDRIWHFDDQYNRNVMTKHFSVQTGDVIQATCVFNSSTRTTPTVFGLDTTDEMCFASLMTWPGTTKATCTGEIWVGELSDNEHVFGIATKHPLADATSAWDGSNLLSGGRMIGQPGGLCVDAGPYCNRMAIALAGKSCDGKLLELLPAVASMLSQVGVTADHTPMNVCCRMACDTLCPEHERCMQSGQSTWQATTTMLSGQSTWQATTTTDGMASPSTGSAWLILVLAGLLDQHIAH